MALQGAWHRVSAPSIVLAVIMPIIIIFFITDSEGICRGGGSTEEKLLGKPHREYDIQLGRKGGILLRGRKIRPREADPD